MSCKTFNLKSCEIRGATYQGRKIDFVNKVITQDTFTAKVYDTQGYLLTEIIGIKSGSVVYFPFTAIQNLSKDKYRIKYWADFYLLGTILLGEEELTIGNSCPNCEVDDSTIPFVLELGTETIDFTLQLVYIAIGNGSGEVDLSEYIKKVDADESYALKNHTHSYNDLTDLPPNQNIDSVVTIGAVTATTNNVNLALHFSGVNRVYIGGENYYKVTEDNFSFTPVTTGIKVLIIYAKADSQIFYLAEGTEGIQAVEPPYTGLFVARLIISSEGVEVEIANTDYKLKLEDGWNPWYVTDRSNTTILNLIDEKSAFYIQTNTVGGLTIGGISKTIPESKDPAKIFSAGREFLIYNATGEDMTIDSAGVSSVDNFIFSDKLTPFTVKNNNAVKVKLRGSELELLPSGSDPDLSGYALQSDLDAEEYNRALEDFILNNKIIAEKNRNDTQDLAIATKLTKPTAPENIAERVVNADNTTSDKGDFQMSEQIEISTSQTAQDAWKGKEIWVTASCTLTIPAPSALSDAWNIDILVFPSITLTLAITSGGTWLHTTPATVSDSFFRIARRGNTTTFKTLGL